MKIEHHGARNGVTGSCHQLHVSDNTSLLVDCGLFQGSEAGDENTHDRHQIDFDISGVIALIATHVHIDHVGRIPWLLAAGFDGPIICSQPSARLLPLVLEDAFKLGISRDRALVERYLSRIESRLVALPYKHWFTLLETPEQRVRVRLQRAGHILGSAYVEVDIESVTRPASKTVPALSQVTAEFSGSSLKYKNSTRIVFSGDLGASHTPLLPAPRPPQRADVLVLESTYGDRNHESRATRKHRLKAAIDRALLNRGTVLIPAFSIGRTQELLYELEELLKGQDDLPVILDSPLASKFTAVYRELQPFWDEEAHARLRQGRKPLAFDTLLTVDSHDEHLKMVHHLARSGRPAIVIAGSGMCNAGRIVNYLKAMLGDKRHDVLFVGYQAEGTPGRAIQQYGPKGGYVELDGERYTIRAGVETIGGYSAHADQQGLVSFVKGMKHRPSEIRLVHGDRVVKKALKAALQRAYSGLYIKE
ncbi:MBL fold metallo-hydrolase RNA specificity domain-containing protein [Marinobacterium marinum]|uniref:MBL fold metallo-hydrolase n=1 Tax=Marinobacterium marinum TaxID=2756129 RepID=A0A7W1WWV9_9GAMM|nr:MBL fold metallo-hydrolase [Marinobacterium marinum]MBA4501531.1 MBL fold metallo-hydrolase [Marinobacterium marinum]